MRVEVVSSEATAISSRGVRDVPASGMVFRLLGLVGLGLGLVHRPIRVIRKN
jgi:hypothetical protein